MASLGTFAAVAAGFSLVFLAPGILASRYLFPNLRISELVAVGFALASALPPLVLWVASYAGVPLVRPVFVLVLVLFYAVPMFLLARRAAATPAFEQRLAQRREFAREFAKNPWPHLLTAAMARRALLVGVVVFGMWLVFVPKLDYRFPLHVDEWWSLGMAKAIVEQHTADIVDPFTGEWHYAVIPEQGFHLWLAYFQSVTGIGWFAIYRFVPMLLFALLQLGVYAYFEREGFGLHAAFITSFFPTTVRILGPSLLVPVSVALVLIFSALLLIDRTLGWKSNVAFGVLGVTVFLVHPPSLAALAAAVFFLVVVRIRSEPRRYARVLAILIVPFLVGLPVILNFVDLEDLLTTPEIMPVPHMILLLGAGAVLLGFVGLLLSFIPPRPLAMAISLTALTFIATFFAYEKFRIGQAHFLNRIPLYVALTIYPMAGFALFRFGRFFAPAIARARARAAGDWRPVAVVVGAMILAQTVAAGAVAAEVFADRAFPSRQQFYRLVSTENYVDWVSVRERYEDEDFRAILGPTQTGVLQASAFAVVSGVNVYSLNPLQPEPTGKQVPPEDDYSVRYRNTIEFFADGCADTEFLLRENIRLVYGVRKVNNDNLTQVEGHPLLWVLGV